MLPPRDTDGTDWAEMYSTELRLGLNNGLDLDSARTAATDTVALRQMISGKNDLTFGESTGPAKITDTPDGDLLGVYTPRRATPVATDAHGRIAGWVPEDGGHLDD